MPTNPTERNAIDKLNEVWGEGNIPPGLSLAFDEPAIPELGIRKCRSFRADLVHKLNVIARAYGTWNAAAEAINTPACVLRSWRAWKSAPGSRNQLSKIDSIYEIAIDRLRVKAQGRFIPPTHAGQ